MDDTILIEISQSTQAAGAKHHRWGGLKTTESHVSQFQKAKVMALAASVPVEDPFLLVSSHVRSGDGALHSPLYKGTNPTPQDATLQI